MMDARLKMRSGDEHTKHDTSKREDDEVHIPVYSKSEYFLHRIGTQIHWRTFL
jgi:hypothetical protein